MNVRDIADLGAAAVEAHKCLTFSPTGKVYLNPNGQVLEDALAKGRGIVTVYMPEEYTHVVLPGLDALPHPQHRRRAEQGHIPVDLLRVEDTPHLYRVKGDTLYSRLGHLITTYKQRWWLAGNNLTQQGNAYSSSDLTMSTEIQSTPQDGFVEVRLLPGEDYSRCSHHKPTILPLQVRITPQSPWELLYVPR